jgi:hypothetical protein
MSEPLYTQEMRAGALFRRLCGLADLDHLEKKKFSASAEN